MFNINNYKKQIVKNKSSFIIIFILISLLISSCTVKQEVQITEQEIKPKIKVEPKSALRDEKVNIMLSNFKPGQKVTIRANTRFSSKNRWESYATFIADENGTVDVSKQKPIEGTYEDIDPMGLFWSMEMSEDKDEEFYRGEIDPIYINFTAEVDGEEVTSTVVERLMVLPEVIRIPVREKGLVGTLFLPESEGNYPVVIVLGGSEGGLYEERAAILASHGYAALALAYFGIDPLPAGLYNIPLEYFKTAIDWLKPQENIDSKKLAVNGFSRGGELALLLGSTFKEIRAVIGYAVSRSAGSEWTYKGESVGGYIPVENINGPVLLISGKKDVIWPSSDMSDMVIDRLTKYDHPYFYKHLSYEGAGHAIFIPYVPFYKYSDGSVWGGGNAKDNAFASVDSWKKVFDFLEEFSN